MVLVLDLVIGVKVLEKGVYDVGGRWCFCVKLSSLVVLLGSVGFFFNCGRLC